MAKAPLTLKDLQTGDLATISVEDAASLLSISLGSARKAVRNGELPALRLGARWLVPVPKLLQLLGVEAEGGE